MDSSTIFFSTKYFKLDNIIRLFKVKFILRSNENIKNAQNIFASKIKSSGIYFSHYQYQESINLKLESKKKLSWNIDFKVPLPDPRVSYPIGLASYTAISEAE